MINPKFLNRIFILTLFILYIAHNINAQSIKYSNVSIPIEVPYSSILNRINQSLGPIISQDTSYSIPDNDGLKYRVIKKSPISLHVLSDSLYFKVPLSVWVSKQWSVMGRTISKDSDFELEATLRVFLSLRSDWQIVPKTKVVETKWTKKPSVEILGIPIDITHWVDQQLQAQLPSIEYTIDTIATRTLDLKPIAQSLIDTYTRPVSLDTSYQAWMIADPDSYYAEPLHLGTSAITFHLAIALQSRLYLMDSAQLPYSRHRLKPLNIIPKLKDTSTIFLSVYVPYSHAELLLQRRMTDSTYTFDHGRSLTIRKLSLNGDSLRSYITILADGTFRGQINLEAIPYLDTSQDKLKMRQVELSISTKNILHKTATWLFESKLERMIEHQMEYSYRSQLYNIRQQLNLALNSNYSHGIISRGQIIDLKVLDMTHTPTGYMIQVQTRYVWRVSMQ